MTDFPTQPTPGPPTAPPTPPAARGSFLQPPPPPPSTSGRTIVPVLGVAAGVIVLAALAGSFLFWKASRPLPKPEYLAQGNAICSAMNDDMRAVGSTIDPTDTSFETWPDVSEPLAEVLGGALSELRALPVPSGDQETLDNAYAKWDDVVATLHTITRTARAGDRVGAGRAKAQMQTQNSDLNRALDAYGLTRCGSNTR